MRLSGLILTCLAAVAVVAVPAFAAEDTTATEPLKAAGASWRAEIGGDGALRKLETECDGQWRAVDFRADDFAGPAWFFQGKRVPLALADRAARRFEGASGDVAVWLRYADRNGKLSLVAGIRNGGRERLSGIQAGLCLGLDCWMEKHPDWNRKFFPTLLRCEKTHFWGYAMSPEGRILGISSPDPVASWHLAYNGGGHRIRTAFLDFLNPGPLPDRHPEGLDSLAPGESREWTVVLEEIAALDQVKPRLAETTGAPMIDLPRYTLEEGEPARITVWSSSAVSSGAVHPPRGRDRDPQVAPRSPGVFVADYFPVADAGPAFGVHTLRVTNAAGRTAEAKFHVRRPWSWYMQKAWGESLAKPQKASTHAESWYGLFTALLAQRYVMDQSLEAQSMAKFAEIVPLMYDLRRGRPLDAGDGRIQNHACMAGLLAVRYWLTQDRDDLLGASLLADLLVSKQGPDGAYRSGRTHYTSVIYPAKSIMEVMCEERKAARDEPSWKAAYDRHYDSVRRAMDDLAKNLDDIQTEGEMTYEDGMISCSAAQLAMFALLQRDAAARKGYLTAAVRMEAGHRCLSQLLVPDCRMNGATLRFWEAQYDVKATPNMLNSPHGWSAWNIYALWYLYQLTGDADCLRQAMNALGSCVQLLDPDSGELRWAFVPDPYVKASLWEQDPASPDRGRSVAKVVGEQYLPMISGWYRAPDGKKVTGYWGDNDGGCCDNDVHEIFKCLEEVALTSAYVVEHAGGKIESWNATVSFDENGDLVVRPADRFVSRVHLNLKSSRRVQVRFYTGFPVNKVYQPGMRWIGPGGMPEPLRAWGEDPATGLDAILQQLGGE